jgi:hypothetical protein
MKGLLPSALKFIVSGLNGLQWKPALLALALAFFGQFTSQDFHTLPVTLHSLLTADYSVDAFYVSFPNINLSLILDVLGDQAPAEASNDYATLQSSLLTPVATVTPLPGKITQVPPSATPTAPILGPSVTPSSIPTITPSPTPSLTPAMMGTGTPTDQPLYTAQPTLKPLVTPTRPRATQIRPTSTRPPQATPTQTQAPPTQAATPTRKPPTATKAPTPTKAPHPYPAPTKPPYP